jgi:hypothetical protein
MLKQLIDGLPLFLNATEHRESRVTLDTISRSAFGQPLGSHWCEADNDRIWRQLATHSMSLLGQNVPLTTN